MAVKHVLTSIFQWKRSKSSQSHLRVLLLYLWICLVLLNLLIRICLIVMGRYWGHGVWTSTDYHRFHQNPYLRTDESNGKPFLFNYSRGQPTKTLYGDWDIDTVPTEPEPTGSTTSQTAECVELLRKIFEERPICTRRVIRNLIPERLHYATKYALPQVSYYWRLGPWRDTCIRFGVDPRKSIEYAKYQVIAFKIEAVKSSKAWKWVASLICRAI